MTEKRNRAKQGLTYGTIFEAFVLYWYLKSLNPDNATATRGRKICLGRKDDP